MIDAKPFSSYRVINITIYVAVFSAVLSLGRDMSMDGMGKDSPGHVQRF